MLELTPNTSSLTELQTQQIESQGFSKIDDILSCEEVDRYAQAYDRFLDGTINAGHLRGDLGGHTDSAKKGVENITQIMWPSHLLPILHIAPAHERCLRIAKAIMGDDAVLDFDMLINKAPGTNTVTPWHQDAAYWVDMPDERSVSFWIALDEATVDNGCMWFVPGSHKQALRPHRAAGKGGGALMCDADESEGVAVPIPAGGTTIHTGRTLHYTRGNTTDNCHRRALILNYRPKAMVELERAQGFDHGLTSNDRKVRNSESS